MTAHPRPSGDAWEHRAHLPRHPDVWSVIHTRGEGVREVAALLSDGPPVAVVGDLRRACIDARADLLVGRSIAARLPVGQAAPVGVDPDRVRSVVAAIGSGPHSPLAARAAIRLAAALGVPASLVAASRRPADDPKAEEALARSGSGMSGIERRLIRVGDYPDLVDSVPPDALLVLGDAGGSWVRRRFSAPGPKMAAAARAGALIIRAAEPRAYRIAGELEAVGPEMLVADARRLVAGRAVPVAKEGSLVGLLRPADLADADPDAAVGTVMGRAESVPWDATMDQVAAARRRVGEGAVPVIGPDGTLIGAVSG